MRATFVGFLFQAFWNGYGRKQLTEKHGSLWGNYRVRRLMSNQKTLISWVRLVAALFGYLCRVLTGFGERLSTTPGVDAPHESDNGARESRPGAPEARPRCQLGGLRFRRRDLRLVAVPAAHGRALPGMEQSHGPRREFSWLTRTCNRDTLRE